MTVETVPRVRFLRGVPDIFTTNSSFDVNCYIHLRAYPSMPTEITFYVSGAHDVAFEPIAIHLSSPLF